MKIIKAYTEQGYELTQDQKDVLFQQARKLKMHGYTVMFVTRTTPAFSGQDLLEFVATNGEVTQRAYVGKRGGLSSGIGESSKRGVSIEDGNALEMTMSNIEKFSSVSIL